MRAGLRLEGGARLIGEETGGVSAIRHGGAKAGQRGLHLCQAGGRDDGAWMLVQPGGRTIGAGIVKQHERPGKRHANGHACRSAPGQARAAPCRAGRTHASVPG